MTDRSEATGRPKRLSKPSRTPIIGQHVMGTAALKAHNANEISGGSAAVDRTLATPIRGSPYARPRLLGGGVQRMCGRNAAGTVLQPLSCGHPGAAAGEDPRRNAGRGPVRSYADGLAAGSAPSVIVGMLLHRALTKPPADPASRTRPGTDSNPSRNGRPGQGAAAGQAAPTTGPLHAPPTRLTCGGWRGSGRNLPLMNVTADEAADFRTALTSLRDVRMRPEIQLEEAPAPQRLAPFALALTADVVVDDEDLGNGRLVVLHDPAGQESWGGTFRVVAFVKATLEPEMAADPLLAEVGWAWLMEALETHAATFTNISGTVTRVTSESFGGLADRPLEGQIEVRASWTPSAADLAPHALAWAEVLGQAAGLMPLPPGVARLPGPRG